MRILGIMIAGLLVAGAAGAATSGDNLGALRSDESNFRELFDQSYRRVRMRDAEASDLTFEVRAGYQSLGELTLGNPYFRVDYASALSGMPTVGLGGMARLARVGDWGLALGGAIGYGFREAEVAPVSLQGLSSRDIVQLHLFSAIARARLLYEPAPVPFVSFFAEPGFGIQYASQAGHLDGLSQGFWLPEVEVGAGAVLFGREGARPAEWFRGLILRLSGASGLGGAQSFSSREAAVGMAMAL